MAGRDWDKEMAEIDRQLAAIPDDALVAKAPAPGPPPPVAARGPRAPLPTRPTPAAAAPRTWRTLLGLLLRLGLGVAALVAVALWPYGTGCGVPLAYYLGAIGAVGIAGLWTSAAAWKHRAALFHALGLTLVAASLVLAAREVLPRVGYAAPTPEQSTAWFCA